MRQQTPIAQSAYAGRGHPLGLSPMGEPRSRRELKESEVVFQDIVDTALKRFGSGLQKVLEDIHRWASFAHWSAEERYLGDRRCAVLEQWAPAVGSTPSS